MRRWLCLIAWAGVSRALLPPRPTAAPRRLGVRRATGARLEKRLGDAASLVSLSLYQQALHAPALLGSVTVDIGGASIRGCRLAACLFVAEKVFKLLRAPASTHEVPVPVEAAGLAMVLNEVLEYAVAAVDGLPRALAHSLGGAPADVATAYLTIIAWRILFSSTIANK
ncbi:hypothetical protein M885DRAFT_531934 [Pelagophyceae sp. CCMP2097]|nr:hypothetical protein M885DRAFT_531934 [Pelagophyceae sp. CCMP2097]|mmetsp:Transcript_17865/g.61669  ORF Transcript_17865/g.61669 Transcript_17865/m.61669 type:complete len:169 (-) Transcript_17865:187-693(-)